MKLARKRSLALAVIGLLGAHCAAPAETRAASVPSAAVQVQLGTQGAGIIFSTAIVPNMVNVNFGASYAGFETGFAVSGKGYLAKVRLAGLPLTVSYFPFGGNFNLSAGMVVNFNHALVSEVRPVADSASGSSHLNLVAPYVGVGWGNPIGASSPFSFVANAGFIFQGGPDVRLGGENGGEEWEEDDAAINGKYPLGGWWPLVSIGVAYAF